MSAAPTPPGPATAPTESFAEATRLLRVAALARVIGEPDAAERVTPMLRGRFALRARTVDLAVDAAVRAAAADVLTDGWPPAEVHRFAQRRLSATAKSYLLDVLAAAAQDEDDAACWREELVHLAASVWWAPGEPHVAQWGARNGRRRAEAIRVAVEVLALLTYLPRPGRHTSPARP